MRRIGGKLAAAALAAALISIGADKRKVEPYGVVAGTVFREPGFALRGAEVVLIPEGAPKKKLKVLTNVRGEFAFRVPAQAMKYTVRASAAGFVAEQKPAAINGEERVEVTFNLRPESK